MTQTPGRLSQVKFKIAMFLPDKLNYTSFFWELLKVTKDILVRHMEVALRSHEPFMDIGTASEKYAKKIFYSFADLNSSINSLELIPTFISINEIPPFYLWNGISETQYYKYHLENHYAKIADIIDFASNFANEVYRLGIPAGECTVAAILQNGNSKDTATASALEKFELHFRQLKRIKNIVIQQNGKPDGEEIKSMDRNMNGNGLPGNKKIFSDWYKESRQAEIYKVINKIGEDNIDVLNFLTHFSDTLIRPFLHNYTWLQSLETGGPAESRQFNRASSAT